MKWVLLSVMLLFSGCSLFHDIDWSDFEPKPPAPTPAPDPVPNPQPQPQPDPKPDAAPDAEALHEAVYSTNGAVFVRWDGSGGFKYNAECSRHTSKIILPGRLAGKAVRVYCWQEGGNFKEPLKRAKPDEEGHRQRYYGHESIKRLPSPLIFRVDVNDGGIPKDVMLRVPNAQKTCD